MTKIKFTTVMLATMMAGFAQPLFAQHYLPRVAQQIAPGPRVDTGRQLNVPGEFSTPPAPQTTFRPVPAMNVPTPAPNASLLMPQSRTLPPQQPSYLPAYQPVNPNPPQRVQQALPQNYQPRQQTNYQPASQPVYQPVSQPVLQPASQPVYQPAVRPTAQPVAQPAPYYQPATQPLQQAVPPMTYSTLEPAPARVINQQPIQYLPQMLEPQFAEAPTPAQIGNDYFAPVDVAQPVISPQQQSFADPNNGLLDRVFTKRPAANRARNRVWGVNALLLSRQRFNDSIDLGLVSTGDVIQDDATAIDVNVITRGEGGKGWELRYFTLFEETATETSNLITPNPFFPIVPGDSITRDSQIQNVEFNLVRQRKNRFLGIPVTTSESIYGFRAFQFRESLTFNSNGFITPPLASPETENLLFGAQLGHRFERQLHGRFGIAAFGKLGVYNNRATVKNGAFTDTKDDVAFIGEADLAATYQFTRKFRGKVGYRALAATELAIADSQVNTSALPTGPNEIDSTGDLILAGGYFGIEFVH